jgi:hypothetical protein
MIQNISCRHELIMFKSSIASTKNTNLENKTITK